MDVQSYQRPEYLSQMQSNQLAEYLVSFQKRTRRRLRRAKLLALVALVLWAVAILILIVPIAPYAWYWLFPNTSANLAERLGVTVDVDKSAFGETLYQVERPIPAYQPPFDPTLPTENRLVIPKIKVNSEIQEGNDWEAALKVGPWRVPELGTPDFRQKPTVMAAHRYGYLTWTNLYRREHSFYNLPKVENGDKVEIIWGQRKYVYEIYEGYTDTKIRDYKADLILYTCELLNSDRRIVRLGRLIET